MPGLTIKQFASTADVEALMCSASAQQHAASSHLVLSVYVACKDHTTGDADLPAHQQFTAHKFPSHRPRCREATTTQLWQIMASMLYSMPRPACRLASVEHGDRELYKRSPAPLDVHGTLSWISMYTEPLP